jgi:hypothetical protein
VSLDHQQEDAFRKHRWQSVPRLRSLRGTNLGWGYVIRSSISAKAATFASPRERGWLIVLHNRGLT